MTHYSTPPSLVDDLRRITRLELSPSSRLGYVALLLGAAAMTVLVVALLLTEPALPARTSLAFGVMAAIGLCWTGFAAWVLTSRRILLGRESVVAGRFAVAFTTVFAVGALTIGVSTGMAGAFGAAAGGLVMLAIALGVWIRARRRFAALSSRRDELERQLRAQAPR